MQLIQFPRVHYILLWFLHWYQAKDFLGQNLINQETFGACVLNYRDNVKNEFSAILYYFYTSTVYCNSVFMSLSFVGCYFVYFSQRFYFLGSNCYNGPITTDDWYYCSSQISLSLPLMQNWRTSEFPIFLLNIFVVYKAESIQ